jgi:5-formyltetrahydrofolate cyclo-ligase
MDKQSLRKWARGKRKELDMGAISAILTEKLVQTEEYKNSKNIMLFYPLPDEVNLLLLLKNKTKNFYLPRIKGDELECCVYKEGDELCESCFHTKEPTCNACNKTNIDMIIVPALAIDKNGYRLGYGGGFYDRFLSNFIGIKVCCIPKEFILETVYPEKHDIKMDLIISS